jgi:FHS family L-fucose permease-like MFS transporter
LIRVITEAQQGELKRELKMATLSTSAKPVNKGAGGTSSKGKNPYLFAFALVTSLFFIFGFITCLNDILVPHLKSLFTLDYTQAALVQFCFFTAYFFASLPSGKLVAKVGYKRGTVLGLLITAAGCLMFYPAAGMQSYGVFLFGLFVLASGITLIQVAVNPYIAVLGPSETASSRLTLAQAFNSLGTTIAPVFGSYLILSVVMKSDAEKSAMDAATLAAYQATHAASVQWPYVGLAIALIVLAVIVGLSHLPTIAAVEGEAQSAKSAEDRPSAWQYRHLVLGAVGIFCYVGAEVAIGSYLINFIGLPDVAGIPAAQAAFYVAAYWGGAMVGRFIGAWVMSRVRPNKVLTFNAVAATVLILVAMAMTGQIAMWAIILIGLCNSIMFPTIFTLAIDRLGKNTAQGSGILCMAIVGGAVIPLVQGRFADMMGLHHSYVLPVVCYLYIAFYGLKGYRFVASGDGKRLSPRSAANQPA